MEQASTGKVLFFIPDISGFTKFVSETEISHSQHIIQELLETLVDASAMGLKVGEFEGDAVLFYRTGPLPALPEFVEQARRMFVAFHTRLKTNEMLRICQCGACSGAPGLTLKIVSHFGPASPMQVKGQVKFIGTGVIVAHRLLKNSAPSREYLLLTRELLDALAPCLDATPPFADGSDAFDEIGRIEYRHMSLQAYHDQVNIDPPKPFALKDPHKVMQLSQHIAAPMEHVYQVMIDLPGRMLWIEGITEVQLRQDGANRIGAIHRCVRSGGDRDLLTSDVKVTDDSLEFWETDLKKMGACRYLLRRSAAGETDLDLEFFVSGNALVRLVFKAFIANKLRVGFVKSLANLAAHCEKAMH